MFSQFPVLSRTCAILVASLGVFLAVPVLAQPLNAGAYRMVPEWESLLPGKPALPTHVCATLKARLKQDHFRLPASVDDDPARSGPDTERLQKAINACPAGRAVKLVVDGDSNAFLAAPFTIKSGVTLWVDGGVTLFASRSPLDYDVGVGPEAGHCGTADPKIKNGCKPWITAKDTENAGIVGEGVIDGRGGAVLTSGPHAHQVTWWDLSIQSKAKPSLFQNNPRMLQVTGGKNFTLYRITLTNGPKFHVGTNDAPGFLAWGIKLITPSLAYSVPGYACPAGSMPEPGKWKISTCFTPEKVKNTDGIDPGNSIGVTVAYSFISTGDDHIAVKAGANTLSKATSGKQRFAHNRLYYGHGMSIGSETDTDLHDVKVWDVVIDGYDSDNNLGLRIKTDDSRGGNVSDIRYRGICMRRVAQPIVLDPHYSGFVRKNAHNIPNVHDIFLQDVHVVGGVGQDGKGGLLTFAGYRSDAVINPLTVWLDNVYFDAAPDFKDVPYEHVRFTMGPGTNLNPPKGSGVDVIRSEGPAPAPYACPESMFVSFPSPLSPI